MILITSKNRAGINIAYPLLVRRLREDVPVVGEAALSRLCPFFITVNLALCVAGLFAGGDGRDRVLNSVGAALLVYVATRVSMQRRITGTLGDGPYDARPAGAAIWLCHLTTGAVFVIFLGQVLRDAMPSLAMRIAIEALLAFFVAYTALPVLNYVTFRALR